MADKNVLEFLQFVERRPDLRAEVQAIVVDDRNKAFAELAAIAQRAGYSVSAEALEMGLRECAGAELSDDEMDAVSGGGINPCTLTRSSLSAFSSFFTASAGIQPCV